MHNESNVSIAQIGYDRIKQKKLSLIETIFLSSWSVKLYFNS